MTLPLPALDGRTPLGFLAALGVLQMVTEHVPNRGADQPARLAWSRQDFSAVLHGSHDTIDALVDDLTDVVAGIPDDGVLPGMPAGFPPPGEAPDKLRLPRPALAALAQDLSHREGPAAERWLSTLVTDLSIDEKQRADITQFAAPSGKQSMRTMLDKPLARVRQNPGLLREALTSWRRHPGVSGEYLDHRVLHDAVDAPDGRPAERGVPGATWLALMSYPLFRTTGLRGEPVTTCWQNHGRSGKRMIYPLWSEPIELHAVQAMLTHQVLHGAEAGRPPGDAAALSIFHIVHAERRRIPGRTFAGVLTPTTRPIRRAGVRRAGRA